MWIRQIFWALSFSRKAGADLRQLFSGPNCVRVILKKTWSYFKLSVISQSKRKSIYISFMHINILIYIYLYMFSFSLSSWFKNSRHTGIDAILPFFQSTKCKWNNLKFSDTVIGVVVYLCFFLSTFLKIFLFRNWKFSTYLL